MLEGTSGGNSPPSPSSCADTECKESNNKRRGGELSSRSPHRSLLTEYKLVPHRKPIETVDYTRSLLSDTMGETFERRYRQALRRHQLVSALLTKGLHSLGSVLVLVSLHLEDQRQTIVLSTIGSLIVIPPILHGLLFLNPQILRLLALSFDFWFTLTLVGLQLFILTCRIGVDARAFAMDFIYFASAVLTSCTDALHPSVRKGGKLQVSVGVAFSCLLGLYVAFNLIPNSRFLDLELLGEHSTDLTLNLLSIGTMLLLRILYGLLKDRRGIVSFVMIRSLVQLVESTSQAELHGHSPFSAVGGGTKPSTAAQPRPESKYAVHPGPVPASTGFRGSSLGGETARAHPHGRGSIVKEGKSDASINTTGSSMISGGNGVHRVSSGTIDKEFMATMDKMRFRTDRLLVGYLGGPGRCLIRFWSWMSRLPLIVRLPCGLLFLGTLSTWSVMLTLALNSRAPSLEDSMPLVIISGLMLLQLSLLTSMLHVDLVVLIASSSFDAVFISVQAVLLILGLASLVEGDLRVLFVFPVWGILQFTFLLDAFLPVLTVAFGLSRQLFGWLLHLTALLVEVLLLAMVISSSIQTELKQSDQYFFKVQNIFRHDGDPLRMWYRSFIITRLFTLIAYRVRLLFRTQHCLVLLRASFSIETRNRQQQQEGEEDKGWTDPLHSQIKPLEQPLDPRG